MSRPKMQIRDLTKVFGSRPERAVELLRQGLAKDEIFERTGQVVGLSRVSFDVHAGDIYVLMLAAMASLAAAQHAMPGHGTAVQPLMSSLQEEAFQTRLIMRALNELGYDVKPIREVEYATAHVAIANGDGTFMAAHWNPLHEDFYRNAGGDARLSRKGQYIANNLQGYLIDKKTADQFKITNLGQLKDPAIARLFDADGDGRADLAGCMPGWGCERVIEHQLGEFGLRGTVTHRQGASSTLDTPPFLA